MFPYFVYLVSGISCVVVAFGMGANNVSNAIGTSVGSGAISVRDGLILAAIFEFLGTALMGDLVTGTLKTAIISPAAFTSPVHFPLGMFGTMITAVVWILFATHYALPISATQTVIGGIVGFAIVENKFDKLDHATLAKIILSWFLSPIIGGILAYVLYYSIYKLVLQKGEVSRFVIPSYYGATFSILIGFILHSNMEDSNLFVFIASLVCFFFVALFVYYTKASFFWDYFISKPSAIDEELEQPFKILMIVSAAFVAFAHGSNDVSNAAAPFSAISEYQEDGQVSPNTKKVPYMVILACGAGIVVGLLVLGYKTLSVVGEKITKLTYSKGYAAQVCGAFTILLASTLSIPISTTAILIGGIVGVGLAGEEPSGVDKYLLLKIVSGWVLTVLVGLIGTPFVYVALKLFFCIKSPIFVFSK